MPAYPTNVDITINPDNLQIGPGNLFVASTPPTSGDPPDPIALTAGVPADGFFMGMTTGPSIVHWGPRKHDFLESRSDVVQPATTVVSTGEELDIEITLKEYQWELLQAALVGARVTPGVDPVPHVVSFGSSEIDVPTTSVLLVVPKTGTNPLKYVAFMIYKAYSSGPIELPFSKAAATLVKVTFRGLADLTREEGDLLGCLNIPS